MPNIGRLHYASYKLLRLGLHSFLMLCLGLKPYSEKAHVPA
jgi:hypothetical protein